MSHPSFSGGQRREAELLAVPRHEVAEAIDANLGELLVELDGAFADERASGTRRLSAVANMGLQSVAKTIIDSDKKDSPFCPAWQKQAREEITRYIAGDPDSRSHLTRTIFFTRSPRKRRMLNRLVFPNIKSQTLSDEALAVEIAFSPDQIFDDRSNRSK